jgi:hypothetical protein
MMIPMMRHDGDVSDGLDGHDHYSDQHYYDDDLAEEQRMLMMIHHGREPPVARSIDKAAFTLGVLNLTISEFVLLKHPSQFWLWCVPWR